MYFVVKEEYSRSGMAKTKVDNSEEDAKEYTQIWERDIATAKRQLEGGDRREVLEYAMNRVMNTKEECYKYAETGNNSDNSSDSNSSSDSIYSHIFSSIPNQNFNSGKGGENLHFASQLSNFKIFQKNSRSESKFDGPKLKSNEHQNLAKINTHLEINLKQVTGNYVTWGGAKNTNQNDLKWTKWRGEAV